MTKSEIRREWLKCAASPDYFAKRYLWIYNATTCAWQPFHLWPAQLRALNLLHQRQKLVILKARQLGLTWLCLAYALWTLLFNAPATVLLFSLREAEAKELLRRLKEIYHRLPPWLQSRRVVQDNGNEWELANGSRALAFSTRGGRSYTGTLALVDEADFVPDLGSFLNAIKPTIDGGGKLALISTSDKRRPVSVFKNLYRAALAATGEYQALFLPWYAHPERDQAWYQRTRAEMHAQRGSDDDFWAEYPATPEEALAPQQLDRRLPLVWLQHCFAESNPIPNTPGLLLPALTLYRPPAEGLHYVIGADPAEGNPHSDASAAVVLEITTGEEVAVLAAPLEAGAFAHLLGELSAYFSHAPVLVERNNHGHSVLLALQQLGRVEVLNGYDGRPGWLNNIKGKPMLYSVLAELLRDKALLLHCPETLAQLASIEASSLRAPAGLPDDLAVALALAVAGGYWQPLGTPSTWVPPQDPLGGLDSRGRW